MGRVRYLPGRLRRRILIRWRYGGPVSNRVGWTGRIAETIVVLAILASMIGVFTFVPVGGFGTLLLWLVSLPLVIFCAVYWTSCTFRLLGHQAFALIGFLVVMFAISGAPVGGAHAILVAAGRTAFCQTVRVERLPREEWNGDRWRYRMRCPDGTTMSLTRAEAEDGAILDGPLRYDPRGWVEALPQAEIDGEVEVLARIWLTLLALLVVQTIAALAAGIVRVVRVDDGWDD
jgi:hypothetical protein